jgi:phosphoserine phosphatase RsbU/P
MARAGHEYPLLYGSNGAPRLLPRAVGQPLGFLEDPAIDVQTLALELGDTLLLYTDGITEATDPMGAFFGGERLSAAAPTVSATTAQAFCDQIVGQLAAFQGDARQADDITLVALRAT